MTVPEYRSSPVGTLHNAHSPRLLRISRFLVSPRTFHEMLIRFRATLSVPHMPRPAASLYCQGQ